MGFAGNIHTTRSKRFPVKCTFFTNSMTLMNQWWSPIALSRRCGSAPCLFCPSWISTPLRRTGQRSDERFFPANWKTNPIGTYLQLGFSPIYPSLLWLKVFIFIGEYVVPNCKKVILFTKNNRSPISDQAQRREVLVQSFPILLPKFLGTLQDHTIPGIRPICFGETWAKQLGDDFHNFEKTPCSVTTNYLKKI